MSERRVAKIRTLVVDDEPLARRNVAALLAGDTEIQLIGECGSAKQAVANILADKPQLVFLDVQMPEHDGFEVLEMLGTELPPAIVFVTAHDEHAVRAFEAGALDYILKPFDARRFSRALARAKERLAKTDIRALMQRIAVRSATGIEFIKLHEVDWIEAADYYACLHVGARSHLLRRSLVTLLRELDPAVFVRIHRSTIVNIDRVCALQLNAAGEYDIVLNDGIRLPLARSYKKAALRILNIPVAAAAAIPFAVPNNKS
jgi:two-component system, LytTR family, response regulator